MGGDGLVRSSPEAHTGVHLEEVSRRTRDLLGTCIIAREAAPIARLIRCPHQDVKEAEATDSKSPRTVVDTVHFERHSRYIKKFTWIDNDLSPRTLSFFIDALNSFKKPWLPAVRVFYDLSLHSIPPFALFASPNLQVLWVTATLVKEEALTVMFDELPLRCRDLQHLHVREPTWTNERGLGESEAFYPVFTDFLHNGINRKALMGLRTLRMSGPIFWEDVLSLAQLPHLEIADLFVCIDPESTADFERLPPGSFPSLTCLRLHLPELGAAGEHLFDSIESTCLTDLLVSISDVAPDTTKTRRFYENLTKSPFCDALTRFSFNVSRISQLEPSNLGSRTMTSSISTLWPLLQLRNLYYLSLGLPRVTLACDDISALASAWPCLQTIQVHQIWDGVTPVCVESLSAFSTRCPKLEHIGFDVWVGDRRCPNETCGIPVPTTSVTHHSCRVMCADEPTYYYTVAYLTLLYPKTSTRELEDEIIYYIVRAQAIADGLDQAAAGEGVAEAGGAGEVAAGEVVADDAQ